MVCSRGVVVWDGSVVTTGFFGWVLSILENAGSGYARGDGQHSMGTMVDNAIWEGGKHIIPGDPHGILGRNT